MLAASDAVLEFLVAGATAVQVGTIAFRRPDAVSRMAAALREALAGEGTTLDALRGSLEVGERVSCGAGRGPAAS